MKKIVVLSGAGISAESGIKTFRDANGLWENHSIEEVASPKGWVNNPALVLDFYNQRRKQLKKVQPNKAHYLLKDLEQYYEVEIITQNVDDLHERAGSSRVLHLHGELKKVCSSKNLSLVYHWEEDLVLGNVAEDKAQLRPFIVWFGEEVPMMQKAIEITKQADIFLIIGTSLQVYPAAGLVQEAPPHCQLIVINPIETNAFSKNVQFIKETATKGMALLYQKLTKFD